MTETDKFQHGLFCWAELATTDPAAARNFYTSLFGWAADDTEIPGGGTYSSFYVQGRGVAAANEQRDDERAQGVPPHWNQYVSVDDVDAAAKTAESAGGTILAPPFDVMEFGRMAILADPAGAVVSMWQPALHQGFGRINEPGAVDWNELMTADLAAAKAFYGEVFGWEVQEYPMPSGPPYTVFKIGDDNVAGAMQTPPDMAGVPSHWTVYFNVTDCDAMAAKVKELGGQVYFGPEAIETVGRFASCGDPQGASFSLLQPEETAQE